MSILILLRVTLLSGTSVAVKAAVLPYLDPTLGWDDRVSDLVGRLSLDEKAMFLQADQTMVNISNSQGAVIGPYGTQSSVEKVNGSAGSTPSALFVSFHPFYPSTPSTRPHTYHHTSQTHLADTPHTASPTVYGQECNSGIVVEQPQNINMAATFNRTLLYLAGRGAGSMLRAENNEGHPQDNASRLSCWSPMMNIARHPLWGRNHEGYGECPYVR